MFKQKMAYSKTEWFIYKVISVMKTKNFWLKLLNALKILIGTIVVIVSIYTLFWLAGEDEMYQMKKEKNIETNYQYENTHLENLKSYYKLLNCNRRKDI